MLLCRVVATRPPGGVAVAAVACTRWLLSWYLALLTDGCALRLLVAVMLAARARPAVPPPVPPRPSKTLVAAALARTRAVGLVPTRRAPPPPAGHHVGDIENLPPKPCEPKRTPSHFADKNERLALRDNVNNAPDHDTVLSFADLKVCETTGEPRKSAVNVTLAANEQKRPSPHNIGYDTGARPSALPGRELDEPLVELKLKELRTNHDLPPGNDVTQREAVASPETHKLNLHVTGPSRRPSYVLPTGQHRHTELAAASRQDRLVHELVRELKETSEQRVASCCRMAAAGSSSALQGLPPLPKSLSGANLVLPEASAGAVYGRQLPVVPPARGGGGRQQPQPLLAIQQRGPPAPPPHRKTPSGLDAQLAVLRNEMVSIETSATVFPAVTGSTLFVGLLIEFFPALWGHTGPPRKYWCRRKTSDLGPYFPIPVNPLEKSNYLLWAGPSIIHIKFLDIFGIILEFFSTLANLFVFISSNIIIVKLWSIAMITIISATNKLRW